MVMWVIPGEYGELPGNEGNYLSPGGPGEHGERVIESQAVSVC